MCVEVQACVWRCRHVCVEVQVCVCDVCPVHSTLQSNRKLKFLEPDFENLLLTFPM